MKYKVIKAFKDLQDGHEYAVNKPYPHKGSVSEERAAALSSTDNAYGVPFIEAVEEELEFPKHVGGGTYELSNGEKIKGKAQAVKSENALKE